MFYAQARFYTPATGRFTAEDPIKDQYNWYGYCDANPVTFVDPMGLAKSSRLFNNQIQCEGSSQVRAFDLATLSSLRLFAHGNIMGIGGGFSGNIDFEICPFTNRPVYIGSTPRFVPRTEWGPIPTYRLTPFTQPVTGIIVHHTAGGQNETINSIDRWHRYGERTCPNTGRVLKVPWVGGIGYHFVIGFDGTVFEGRPIDSIGTHAGNLNSTTIGIAFQGNFSTGAPSQAQMDSFYWLIDRTVYQVPTITWIGRHHDSCPGPWFDDLIDELNERINS